MERGNFKIEEQEFKIFLATWLKTTVLNLLLKNRRERLTLDFSGIKIRRHYKVGGRQTV